MEGGSPYFKAKLDAVYQEHQPRQAVFTHGHEDHAGNVDLFNKLGITPHVHQSAINYLASPPVIPYYRRFVWGTPAAGQSQIIGEVIETEKHAFQVIASPGHSEDHLCLYEEKEGWLFTGDLYVGERIFYLYKNENLPRMKETLKKLAALDFSTLFCSHRGPLQKGPEVLTRKLLHIEALEEKARALQLKGLSLPDITRQLLGKEDYMRFISKGEFSKTALVVALLNHGQKR
ncbi:MAG: MBL fold metallo-hydrolase [Dethiobacter sp.]|nr:MBL fold metallo-hydrolase [Dethiobacter sp.]MBS3897585.1 MBL fold metallo-hydrolase [Dethiobacter sp.]MBS3983964.1 MBL fold metallo-hydrolase [Dethiobacter sp.]MCL4463823.1 MBL fold metallo-hydrolase [Bacillota bacterium]MCL5993442.1 MBL fold metallo-hydrolase [Bacillota bacterium]